MPVTNDIAIAEDLLLLAMADPDEAVRAFGGAARRASRVRGSPRWPDTPPDWRTASVASSIGRSPSSGRRSRRRGTVGDPDRAADVRATLGVA